MTEPNSQPQFIVYRDAAGEWRWHLVAGNGRKIADSGEGYRSKTSCLKGINLVKGLSENTRIEILTGRSKQKQST